MNQDRAKRAEAEIIHGSLFYFKSHFTSRPEIGSEGPRQAGPHHAETKISTTRHQWPLVHGLSAVWTDQYDALARG